MSNIKESICIKKMPNGSLNSEDRLDLCRLLAKAGYTVAVEKRKIPGKRTTEYVVVGYIKEGER